MGDFGQLPRALVCVWTSGIHWWVLGGEPPGARGGCQLLAEETVYAVVAYDRGGKHAPMPAGKKERLSSSLQSKLLNKG